MNVRQRAWGDAPRRPSTNQCRLFALTGLPAVAGTLVLLLWLVASPAFAAPTLGTSNGFIRSVAESEGCIEVVVNKSQVLQLTRPAAKVSVVNPEIADVQIISPQQIVVTGQEAGETTLVVWDESEDNAIFDVTVIWNIASLQKQIDTLFPNDYVTCRSVEGAVALEGQVASLESLERIVELAGNYSPVVLNLLQVPGVHQVLVEVRIAELSREFRRELGTNMLMNSQDFMGVNRVGGLITPDGALDSLTLNDAISLMFGFPNSDIQAFVQALQQKGLLRILAEPNLVALSGEPASFLVGGEFPVPVVQGGAGSSNTSITVEWREFGVRLNFTPTVYGNGKIRLHLQPEVSDLDFTSGVQTQGFVIPGILQRRAETTVDLIDGQTFAIAGLISAKSDTTVRKVPALGNVPILGALFRSSEFQEEETEMVMLVTPHLVEPMQSEQLAGIQLPGEDFEGPSDKDFYLHGQIETQEYHDFDDPNRSPWPEARKYRE